MLHTFALTILSRRGMKCRILLYMIAYRYNRSVSARNPRMPDSGHRRIAASAARESLRRHARATFYSGQLPRRRTTPKSSTHGKGHMKLIFTGLFALCTIAAAFADENKFGPAWVEGHNYKVVDGQLVDLGPAPIPTPTPPPTPPASADNPPAASATPGQPGANIPPGSPVQIVINNNATVQAPPPAPGSHAETSPSPQVVYVPVSTPLPPVQATASSDFVVSVLRTYNNHDYLALSPYLVPGHVNYFGHRYASPSFIRNDMTNDARTYTAVNCTYYPDTFTHDESNDDSPHWVGPMLYDNITTYTEARDFNGRVHRATIRFTVGYTVVNGVTNIYAMVLKVI